MDRIWGLGHNYVFCPADDESSLNSGGGGDGRIMRNRGGVDGAGNARGRRRPFMVTFTAAAFTTCS